MILSVFLINGHLTRSIDYFFSFLSLRLSEDNDVNIAKMQERKSGLGRESGSSEEYIPTISFLTLSVIDFLVSFLLFLPVLNSSMFKIRISEVSNWKEECLFEHLENQVGKLLPDFPFITSLH